MTDTNNNIDDVRYQHHLEHRGSANQRIFWVVWSCIAISILAKFGRDLYIRWRRRAPRTNTFQALSSTEAGRSKRMWGWIRGIAVAPLPLPSSYSLTTLPVGKIIGLTAYLVISVSLLLSVDAPASTAHFVDDVAFRAAWVTIVQIPLVFLLSTKRGPINTLSSISYDRMIWIHKWVGRTIVVSATTHVAIMKSSISLSEVLLSPGKSATVVRYGIGSYSLLLWIAVSSILPLRKWSYRVFYINHWISTLGFLMVILQHVPKHAMIPVYMAFAIVSLDRILALVSFLRSNFSVRPLHSRFSRYRRAPGRAVLVAGYPVEMHEPHNLSVTTDTENSTTTIRICNVPITWRPGQHIRLYLPALGAFEMHPFTPANCSNIATPPPLPPRRSQDVERQDSALTMTTRPSNDILLMIRAHSGLTQRLKEFHAEWLKLPCPNATLSSNTTSLTAYVDGPYGSPPSWENYENLTLVTTSTGVSFALSIMDYLEQLCLSNASQLNTQIIRFVWITRHIDPQFEATVAESLKRYSTMLKDSGVRVETELYVTCSQAEIRSNFAEIDQFAHLRPRLPRSGSGDRMLTIRNPDEIYDEWEEEERQWAEMEALEEMQMKQADPFADANEIPLAYNEEATTTYESDGYASSETSTLLDGTDVEHNQPSGKSFLNDHLAVDGNTTSDGLRPLLSPVRSPLLPRKPILDKKLCQCALVQHQYQKLNKSGKSPFNIISYGVRPDVLHAVRTAVGDSQYSKSMVAACANVAVSKQVKQAVSEARIAFARGERATDVEIFTEGFS
ncbi:hypothetical protein E8E13_010130 [Curvularia kusanoi]|uniref:FAD-binding FR-type domain-containing protein n=1 Tax=Curvularia kusanoi TaxID=90978 RepID=A0A9P4WDK4_CURKU|nr:hypothetical protein E8E13_010130 [Curvularia kusanoi]